MGTVALGTGEVVPDEAVRACLLAATAAPSVHNTQPWLFRVRPEAIEVLVDPRRQLRTIDPDGREMYVSVGAAVFNLRLALRARGWVAEAELAPDWAQPDLAARVVVLRPAPPEAQALAAAIPRRCTNRRPFADAPVPAPVLDELVAAAAGQGARVHVADTMLRQAVLSLTRTAEGRQRRDPGYLPELRRWTTPGGPGRRDGVPRQALGPRDIDTALPLRDFAIAHGLPTTVVEFERNPTIALLLTTGDRLADWLTAGMALQSVLLTATVRGLGATPLSQLTEVAALRGLLADDAAGRVVQTVLRLGYALHPATPSPRRPLDDVVVDRGS
jgi:nitroreductase